MDDKKINNLLSSTYCYFGGIFLLTIPISVTTNFLGIYNAFILPFLQSIIYWIMLFNENIQSIKDGIISLVEILLSLFALFFIMRLFILLSRESKEIIILPFEVNTSKKIYNGRLISDNLTAELRRIFKIIGKNYHFEFINSRNDYLNELPYKRDFNYQEISLIDAGLNLPTLKPFTENFDYKISVLGGVDVGGVNVSMSSILAVLRGLWPFGEGAKTIRGYLHENDSEIHLISLMEKPDGQVWNIDLSIEDTENIDILPELIEDSAYMVAHNILHNISIDCYKKERKYITNIPTNWSSLKYVTRAYGSFSKYMNFKKFEYLKDSKENCLIALEKDPELDLFNLIYSIGMAYCSEACFKESTDLFELCTKLEPNNVNGFIGLGDSLLYLGREEEALEAYERAIIIDPHNKIAWYQKGVFFDKFGQSKKALEAIDSALRIDKKYALAWCSKGLVLDKLKRQEEALEAYKKSVKIDPNDPATWFLKGLNHFTLGQYKESLKAFNKSLDLNPTVQAYLCKGYSILCLHEKGLDSINNALEAFREATLIDPNVPEPWSKMGHLYFESYQFENALTMYKIALKMYSSPKGTEEKNLLLYSTEYKDLLYRTACCYALIGNKDNALEFLKQSIAINPSYREMAKKGKAFENLKDDEDFMKIVTVN